MRAQEETTNGSAMKFRLGNADFTVMRTLLTVDKLKLDPMNPRLGYMLRANKKGPTVSDKELHKALWDLDLAINNNPKFLAAVKLKEELLGRRQWDEENSLLRDFVTRQIQHEQGREGPPFGRPAASMILPNLQGPRGFAESFDEESPIRPATAQPHGPPATAPANGEMP